MEGWARPGSGPVDEMPRTVRSAARDRTLGTGMPHAGFIFFADPDMILLHLLWMLIAGLIGALIARLIALFAKNARYAYGRILLAGAAQTGVCWAAREWVPHDLSVVLIVLISGILLYRHLARGLGRSRSASRC